MPLNHSFKEIECKFKSLQFICWGLLLIIVIPNSIRAQSQQSPPNILWITCEDISPNLGCYGDPLAYTPNLDALAEKGVLYTHAFATAPVCAVARSSIITGMYSTSYGAQHMRCKARMPQDKKTYPEYLREIGYFCTNNRKTDYNIEMNDCSVWDRCSNKAHWRDRKNSQQPFFSIFNFTTSHESRVNDSIRHIEAIANVPEEILKTPDQMVLPPYFPDTEQVRKLWARYYNNITAMDQQVGELLAQLEADGLSENTIVIFYSDHGAGVPRHKRWLYDSGLRIPLIVYLPPQYQDLSPHKAGTKSDELVSFIDLPPTLLNLADYGVFSYMEGRAFLGKKLRKPRRAIYAGRDRMDERYDMQRAVRDRRYKYICYYEPYKPYCQYMNTPEKGAIMKAIREAQMSGSMPTAGGHIIESTKPKEELFDTENDPFELNNLVGDPQHQMILSRMRRLHARWSDRTKDTGLIPETILRNWEKKYDASIYDIMRSQQIPINTIRETALGEIELSEAIKRLTHSNAAIRYWAAIQLGNQVVPSSVEPLRSRVEHETDPTVLSSISRALIKLGKSSEALPTLEEIIQHEDSWVRLQAALVLDEAAEACRPLLPQLKKAMQDENRYVVRVVNHTINVLEGTENVVR